MSVTGTAEPTDPIRHVAIDAGAASREFLVGNGLGGFSSGTILGTLTRRYHGVLVAALPAPFGRTVMLSRLDEAVAVGDGEEIALGERSPDSFRLELGLPVWAWRVGAAVLEKRLVMRHMQNSVDVVYSLSGAKRAQLLVRPWICFRGIEDSIGEAVARDMQLTAKGDRFEFHAGGDHPPLRLHVYGGDSTLALDRTDPAGIEYWMEAERGYAAEGTLWSPGRFSIPLTEERPAHLAASTEAWYAIMALTTQEVLDYERRRRRRLIGLAAPGLREGAAAELVLAADSFVIEPEGRIADEARARAAGDEARTIIAGYHWFTDWGRDTMISLEGLTLTTGRHAEAGWILRTFAHYVRDGLIPNMFPEGGSDGLYHTADATLWFFHALHRYVRATGDRDTLRGILPKLREIIAAHLGGTRFGIGVDHSDGLLRQGAEGYQLTWMDAKVDGWVVTPRRGKAVEINALWYNALCLMADWLHEEGAEEEAQDCAERAAQARASFNRRFWSDELGHLRDVVDGPEGDDAACRPNQVLAVSLDHPILDEARWAAVMKVAAERLLTPVGLRSLDPGHPDYKPRYEGDLRSRDAAYHQGTVWGWLIGPFVDGWLKVHPEDLAGARAALEGFVPHLADAGIGTVSEIFDAEPPFSPRGCISQAWSVAELLRLWEKTAPDSRG